MTGRVWTDKEHGRFKELYPYFTNKFMAVIFDRTELAMKRRGQQVGLTKLVNPSHLTVGMCPVKEKANTKGSKIKAEKTKKENRDRKARIKGLRDEYGLTKILSYEKES